MHSPIARYLAKRLALLVPTLIAIIGLNFLIVQFAPGGPVDTVADQTRLQEMQNHQIPASGIYQGAQGLDPALIEKLNRQFGFDKSPLTRFALLLRGDLTFHLGTSFFLGRPVTALVLERLPVSLSLGLWSTLLVYLIAIPLGIHKARHVGTSFDTATSLLVLAAYAVPGFLLAIILIVLCGAGGVLPLFPLQGLTSPGATAWPWPARIADYAWHLVLPTLAMTAGGFATLTLLTKNACLEEFGKLYVTAARAKGASETRLFYSHIFCNAALPLVAGFPGAFMAILFTSSLLVEIIFSVNGLGLLGYDAVQQRDYPVMFGTLYIYTLAALVLQLIGDILTMLIDPRVDFEG
jgi:microcin C transport system permease protein